jgi:hypothetical protein
MERDLLTLIHRWNSGQVLQSTSWSSPYLKTLEVADIPGAAYKAVVLLRQQILPLSRASDNRRYCSCYERQSVS